MGFCRFGDPNLKGSTIECVAHTEISRYEGLFHRWKSAKARSIPNRAMTVVCSSGSVANPDLSRRNGNIPRWLLCGEPLELIRKG